MALSPKGETLKFLGCKITTNDFLQLKLQQIPLFLLVHGLTTILLVGRLADEDRSYCISFVFVRLDRTRLTYLLTHSLTPWCRVLLEKLTGLKLVKKFLPFHGTRMFITALTSVRHLSLSWASPIQSIHPHPSSWRSVLILSTHLRLGLPSGLFPSGFHTKTLYTPSPQQYAPHAQLISFFSISSPAQYWVRGTNHLALRYAISYIPPLPRPSWVQIFSSTPCSQTPSASFPPAM